MHVTALRHSRTAAARAGRAALPQAPHHSGARRLATAAPFVLPSLIGVAAFLLIPAAYADPSGGATTVPCGNAAGGPDCAAPQAVPAPPGAGTEFIVDAGYDGYYDLRLRTSGASHETGRFQFAGERK